LAGRDYVLTSPNPINVGSSDIVITEARSSDGAGHADAAAASAALAQKWANEEEDTPVVGDLYSAFHWAMKAAEVVVAGIAAIIHGSPVKDAPVDADELALVDSEAAWAGRKLTWAKLKERLVAQLTGTVAGTFLAGDKGVLLAGSTGLKGYTADVAADDGNIAGTTYEPVPLTRNWRKVTNNGAGTFKAPTTAGCYSMTVRVINTASAGAITFTGFTAGFPKGDTLTLSATGVFDVVISKMDSQCTAYIVQVVA
jgi:hypothetical protein